MKCLNLQIQTVSKDADVEEVFELKREVNQFAEAEGKKGGKKNKKNKKNSESEVQYSHPKATVAPPNLPASVQYIHLASVSSVGFHDVPVSVEN